MRPRRGRFWQTLLRTMQLTWRADRRTFVTVGLLSLIPAAIPPVLVVMARSLVDHVSDSTSRDVARSEIIPIVIAVGLLTGALRITNAWMQMRRELFSRQVHYAAERLFLEHAATVDLGYFDQPDWYDRVARVRRDVSWRPGQMTWSVLGLATSMVTLVGMAAVLFSLHPFLVVVVFGSILPGLLIQHRVNKRDYEFWWSETPAERERDYMGQLLSGPPSAKEIRSFGLTGHLAGRHRALSDQLLVRYRRILRTQAVAALVQGSLGAVSIALAYGFVGFQGIDGKLSAGALTAVIAAFTAITGQLGLLSNTVAALDQHAPFLDDYFSFLAIEPIVPLDPQPARLPDTIVDGVRFENVDFTYRNGNEPALRGVNLHIAPGEMIALVGVNGAGKTSLIKLLLRFYDPDDGRITIDGVDLRRLDPIEWRHRVGVLFQDYNNYELTVRDNVIFGRIDRTATDHEVLSAIQAARASQVVEQLSNGLDSNVGRLFDGGHDLSGGQWQRLALARLIHRDAEIWVLDEPTSALDPEAETAVFAEIRENLRGRIGIIISHRFSTVRIADRIAVMEQGRICELGTHDELRRQGGRYAALFELQAKSYR